jgi:hypothetical protein
MIKILHDLHMGVYEGTDDGDSVTGVGNLKVFAAIKALQLTRKAWDVFGRVENQRPHLAAVEAGGAA